MPDTGITDGTTVINSSLWDTYLRQQVVAQVTAATRPTGVEGRLIYETDTNYLRIYNSAWKLLAGSGTYTPTLVGMAVGTGGSATNTAAWTYTGNADGNGVLVIEGNITFGTSGTTFPAATITASLPTGFTAISTSTGKLFVGVCELVAAATGYDGRCRLESSTTVRFAALNAAGTYTAVVATSTTIPNTWAAGDGIYWSATIRCTAP